MAYIAADQTGEIHIFKMKPIRAYHSYWARNGKPTEANSFSKISKNICNDLIGKVLTWEDKAFKI